MITARQLRELLEGEPDDAIIMVEFGDYLKAAESVVGVHMGPAPMLIAVSTHEPMLAVSGAVN